jgi:Uma2 family endonuclease
MLEASRKAPTLTKEETDALFLALLEDDTEEAPWIVMADLQFWPTSAFAKSLQYYARQNSHPWYVASMLPIIFRDQLTRQRHQLAPDVLVARVPDRPHTSYDVAEEGVFPQFVLEVVSPSSTQRDQVAKREAYRILGAQEYALFTPRLGEPSTLAGYRRGPEGEWLDWQTDADGRLWSEVLALYLIRQDEQIRAQTPEGRLLPTYEELQEEREREANARRQAEAEREREANARRQAEAEREREAEARRRLEAEIERLRRRLSDADDSPRH